MFISWFYRLPAPDKNYKKAQKLYKAGKYYSAYQYYKKSTAADAKKMAKKCIQKWPKNGEIWRSDSAKSKKKTLVFDVNPPEDYAYLIRLYKSDKLVSCLFFGKPGKVTVKLPSGKYTIKTGVGKQWFGVKEAFGRSGYYQTLSLNGSEVIDLSPSNVIGYNIWIDSSNAAPNADSFDSVEEDWDNFAEDI